MDKLARNLDIRELLDEIVSSSLRNRVRRLIFSEARRIDRASIGLIEIRRQQLTTAEEVIKLVREEVRRVTAGD